MTSRLKNDPDMRYFTEHLQERPAGRHVHAQVGETAPDGTT